MLCNSAYPKTPKYSDTRKHCCNHPKILTKWLYHRVLHPKDADGMANSVDPDQTAPLGAVWSGSTLFAQACLSENLGSLRYLLGPVLVRHFQTHHRWSQESSQTAGTTCQSGDGLDQSRNSHIHCLKQKISKFTVLYLSRYRNGTKWATSWENLFMPYANNKGTD